MSSAYNLPDYRNKYFEHKTLTKIYGQPTIDAIVQLFTEVKRNSQKVKCSLSGGQHGYLPLVISAADHLSIPGTVPFIRPMHPGTFTPVATPVTTPTTTRASVAAAAATAATLTLTAADVTTQKIVYDKSLHLYNECQAVE